MTSKIRWNSDECAAVREEVKRLVLSGSQERLLYLVRRAQRVLPFNRHRKLLSFVNGVPPALRGELNEGFLKWKKARVAQAIERFAEKEAQAIQLAPSKLALPPATTQKTIVELLAELLAQVLEQPRVHEAAREFGAEILHALLEQQQQAARTPPVLKSPEARNAKQVPTALIVGLRLDQHAPFDRRYAEALRIKYWHDESASMLRDKARAADVVFVAVGNVAHQSTELIRSTPGGGDKMVYSRGGNTEMMSQIDAWLQSRGTPAQQH